LYVNSIQIENLRCFENAELHLQHATRINDAAPEMKNINLLLGTNGAGKTTTLKAIALATLSPVITQSGYVPYRLVRRTGAKKDEKKQAKITANLILHSQDVDITLPLDEKALHFENLTTRVRRFGDTEKLESELPASEPVDTDVWEGMYYEESPAFLLVGYGATRTIVDAENFVDSKKLLRYQRVAGLFEPQVVLRPLASWLPQFAEKNPGRYKQVVHLIDRLLPDEAEFTGLYEKGEYLFEFGRTKVPFGAMSDGYRAYIGWIADLIYHICMGAPRGAKLVDNYGVVLVDEIDLHLHPEWQRTVVSRISKALPNLQFVFSTHSPIVAGSLHKENIFVMETDSSGASRVHQYEERIYGLDAEQVLLSSYFNLTTTRAPGFVDELQSLSKKASKDDPGAALALMQKLAGQSDTVKAANNGKPDDSSISATKKNGAKKKEIKVSVKTKSSRKKANK
jgi:predicted ATPase